MARKDHKRRLPQLTTRAKIIVFLVVLVFLGTLGIYVVTSSLSKQLTYSDSGVTEDFSKKSAVDRQKDAVTIASDALNSGNETKATTVYDKAIAAEPDATKKVELAIDESSMLYGAGKCDDAIKVAKTAEGYSTDKYLISDWLGRLYEGCKQYTEAVTYYERAGTLADSSTNTNGYTKKHYDAKVASVKALEKDQ